MNRRKLDHAASLRYPQVKRTSVHVKCVIRFEILLYVLPGFEVKRTFFSHSTKRQSDSYGNNLLAQRRNVKSFY